MNAATTSVINFLTACGQNTNAEARNYLATTDVEAEMSAADWTVDGEVDWYAVDRAVGADVTNEQIAQLGTEAAEAGDMDMCVLVAQALDGNADARNTCIDAIVANR